MLWVIVVCLVLVFLIYVIGFFCAYRNYKSNELMEDIAKCLKMVYEYRDAVIYYIVRIDDYAYGQRYRISVVGKNDLIVYAKKTRVISIRDAVTMKYVFRSCFDE